MNISAKKQIYFYCAIPHFHSEVRTIMIIEIIRNISYREMYGNPGFPNKEMLPGGRAGESEYETASRSI